MSNHIVNLNNKPLKDFTPDDTLYIRKLESGYAITFYCKFIELKRGVVVAEVINHEPNYGRKEARKGERITARPSSCYLWGRRESDKVTWLRCNWFKNVKEAAS